MRIAPVCACALAVTLSGVAHGLYTNRWQTAPDPREVQPRLDKLPAALGPWAARDVAVEAEALERGGIRAHLSREYRDARGRSVRVLLVAGRPGPISVHTPDICFQGAGFDMTSDPEVIPVGPAGAKFWSATFAKPDAAVPGVGTLVALAWNGGSGWEAPDHRSARVRYALRPVLYKLYLVTEPPASRSQDGADVFGGFASQLIPELDRVLADSP